MQRQGFRYWPVPVASVAERKVGAYAVDDIGWARQYGYGRPFDTAAMKTHRDHPNITYATALPKKERLRLSPVTDRTRP